MCGSAEEAERIARSLVEKRLVACVNLVPGVRSIYRWKDVVEDTQEVLMVIKSSRALLNELRTEIEKLHSYEVPEVIAMQIVDGAEAYLDWMSHELVVRE